MFFGAASRLGPLGDVAINNRSGYPSTRSFGEGNDHDKHIGCWLLQGKGGAPYQSAGANSLRLLAVGLELDLPAHAQDVDAVRMVAVFILSERFRRSARGGKASAVVIIAA